jgi:hypothetical protein
MNVGKKGGSRWAALADSDTETDTEEPREARHRAHLAVDAEVSVPVAKTIPVAPVAVEVVKKVVAAPVSAAEASSTVASLFDDPLFAAMDRGEVFWGDLLSTCCADKPVAIPVTPAEDEDDEPLRSLWANPSAPLRAKEEEIWQQPFSTDLEEYWPETYDTRAMSDADYHALMGWLYSKGWWVDSYDRAGVRCWTDNAPSRRWDSAAMAPEGELHVRWADMEEPKPKAKACCGGHGPRPAPAKKGPVTIPRFCREAHACSAAGCRYVHGDTIPRLNESCAFGEGCGASDPTGVKRSQCLRMHPGETWTPELVIRRP